MMCITQQHCLNASGHDGAVLAAMASVRHVVFRRAVMHVVSSVGLPTASPRGNTYIDKFQYEYIAILALQLLFKVYSLWYTSAPGLSE